jgi:hypothetical protein
MQLQLRIRHRTPSRFEQLEELAWRAWSWKTAAAVGVAGALGGLAYGAVRKWHHSPA